MKYSFWFKKKKIKIYVAVGKISICIFPASVHSKEDMCCKVFSYKGLDCITELNKVLQPGLQRGNNKNVFHKIPAYNKTYNQLNPSYPYKLNKHIKHAMNFFL